MDEDTNTETLSLVSLLTDVAGVLGAVRTLEEMADAVLDVLSQVISVEYTGFFLLDPEDGRLRLVGARGFEAKEREEAARTASERHPGWVVRTGQMLHVPDTDADPERKTQDSSGRVTKIRSRLFMPVKAGTLCVGAYGFAAGRPHAFSETHLALLRYAASLTGATYGRLVNERKLAQQLALLEEKQRELLLLSSPVIELGEHTLALPIIGTVDRERARYMAEQLLFRVVSQRARHVILDFTGTAELPDTALAEVLRIVSAVELLGSRCVLSGISPRLAQTVAQSSQLPERIRSYASLKQALLACALPQNR